MKITKEQINQRWLEAVKKINVEGNIDLTKVEWVKGAPLDPEFEWTIYFEYNGETFGFEYAERDTTEYKVEDWSKEDIELLYLAMEEYDVERLRWDLYDFTFFVEPDKKLNDLQNIVNWTVENVEIVGLSNCTITYINPATQERITVSQNLVETTINKL
ncbi:hypothetical protein [Bacillus sp. Brlt_9]|uniref:hypothetical protein n=1 Tax=Bacillus sp. Brlt_9 TaxID=3110916 RepID=UPI003F7B5215